MKSKNDDQRPHGHGTKVTSEVGDEGGTPGDVEHDSAPGAGHGSEATETWSPDTHRDAIIRRDETGRGRRSP